VPNWDRADIIRSTKGAYYPVLVLVHYAQVIYESSDLSLDVAQYAGRTFGHGCMLQ